MFKFNRMLCKGGMLAGLLLAPVGNRGFVQADDTGAAAPAVLLDGVAATVNDAVVTVNQVLSAMQPLRDRLVTRYSGAELAAQLRQTYQDTLRLLTDQELIHAEYERQDAKLPEWLFDRRAAEIRSQMFGDDREAFVKALARDGLTQEEWLKQIRKQTIVSFMRREHVEQRVHVAPRDVREFYDQHRDRYQNPARARVAIITMSRPRDADAARARRAEVEQIRARAAAGEDFAALARAHSEDRRAADGGAWGWIEPRMVLRPELAQAVEALEPGEVGDVIETDRDFYLVKLEARQAPGAQSFEEVQGQIERDLRQRQTEILYRQWIERLGRHAHVKLYGDGPF